MSKFVFDTTAFANSVEEKLKEISPILAEVMGNAQVANNQLRLDNGIGVDDKKMKLYSRQYALERESSRRAHRRPQPCPDREDARRDGSPEGREDFNRSGRDDWILRRTSKRARFLQPAEDTILRHLTERRHIARRS